MVNKDEDFILEVTNETNSKSFNKDNQVSFI